MLDLILLVFAFVLLLVQACGFSFNRVSPGWLGLALFVLTAIV